MKTFFYLTKRNIQVFFTDRGMLFTSMITPVILLVLYSTFLADNYKKGFEFLTQQFNASDEIINSIVSGQIVASLLAVCCVTVSFCSNVLIAQDKVKKVLEDFLVSPIKRSTLQLSYFVSTWISTIIVNFIALIACLIYVACTGWFLSITDILLLIVDILILSAFGSAFSSAINFFLKTEGQISCVGTIVSAGYGFVCGAYFPLNQIPEGIKNVFMFLPGTYGTVLIKQHALNGVMKELQNINIPEQVISEIQKSIDYKIDFFSHGVPVWALYLTIILGIVIFLGIYVIFSILKRKKAN